MNPGWSFCLHRQPVCIPFGCKLCLSEVFLTRERQSHSLRRPAICLKGSVCGLFLFFYFNCRSQKKKKRAYKWLHVSCKNLFSFSLSTLIIYCTMHVYIVNFVIYSSILCYFHWWNFICPCHFSFASRKGGLDQTSLK